MIAVYWILRERYSDRFFNRYFSSFSDRFSNSILDGLLFEAVKAIRSVAQFEKSTARIISPYFSLKHTFSGLYNIYI